MATNPVAAEIPTLQVRRTIRADQATVYAAWTTPAELQRWQAPGPLHVSLAEMDVRVGGSYRIHMVEPDGVVHKVSGVYAEVDPPRKLVYTWGWESDNPVKDSVVTIEFHERGDSTDVVLTHAIANDKERASHAGGWTSILEKLDTICSGVRS